ncbi:MAG: flagella basal body P-ring formation protein FlgA [Sphingomonadales bacterium]
MKSMIAAATAILAVGTAQAVVPQFEDLSVLQARIGAFLGPDAGTQVQPLDQRLRLTRCPEPATIEMMVRNELVVRCAAIGWRLRVPVIAPMATQAAIVIRRGDSVELAVGGNGFSVVSTAIAMEDGREGGVVRVKSSTGTTTVTGRVDSLGRVVISN